MSKEMIRIVTTEGFRICHPTEDLFEGVSAVQGGIFMVEIRSGEEREWTWSVGSPRSPEATPELFYKELTPKCRTGSEEGTNKKED